MSYRWIRFVRIVFPFTIAIFICVMGFFIYSDQKEQQTITKAWKEAESRAQPYHHEIRDLVLQLDELRAELVYEPENAPALVGFMVSDASDLPYMKALQEQYGFSPVIVLDCTADMTSMPSLSDLAATGWEIMLYAPSYSRDVHESVLETRAALQAIDVEDTGVFFLRKGYTTEANVKLLMESGFFGYTVFNDSPASGQTAIGHIFFDYAVLQSDTSIESRLDAACSAKATMIYTLDMESVREGTIPQEKITEIFDVIKQRVNEGKCSFQTVKQATNSLLSINQIKDDLNAQYEREAAIIRARIDELEDTIRDIYREYEQPIQ